MRFSFFRLWAMLRHYGSFWHLKRALIYLWVDVILLSFVRRGASKDVLVLKYDQLGDYIIVRNFLRLIRDCEAYRTRRIVLCANRALREFIETYDAAAFHEIIWFDRTEMINTVWTRFHYLRTIKARGADVALKFMYELEAFSADCVVRASGARTTFGRPVIYQAASDGSGARSVELGDSYFNPRVHSNQVMFDFYRHQAFFSLVVPGVEMPRDMRLVPVPVDIPEISAPFAILMPGASDAFREWPAERFAAVARHLSETRGLEIVVLGTETDSAKARSIQRAAPAAVVRDLCGQVNLNQVVCLLDRCGIGITNDSGGIHILAALNKPGVAVSTCFSFGYFHPYPSEICDRVTFVYPDAFYALPISMDERRTGFARGKCYPITDVTTRNVIDRIEALLSPGFRDPIHDVKP